MTFSAAAAAKSLQLCPTLCDPIDGSPPGSPVPGILHSPELMNLSTLCLQGWRVECQEFEKTWADVGFQHLVACDLTSGGAYDLQGKVAGPKHLVECLPSASQLLAFSPGKEQAAGVPEKSHGQRSLAGSVGSQRVGRD